MFFFYSQGGNIHCVIAALARPASHICSPSRTFLHLIIFQPFDAHLNFILLIILLFYDLYKISYLLHKGKCTAREYIIIRV